MLYKKLYVVGLSVYGLNTISTAENYTAYAAQVGSVSWSCTNAGPNDHCFFHCDTQQWAQDINCESAATCQIYAEERKCFRESTISATHSSQLIIHPGTADVPFMGATFNLPSTGYAYFLPAIATNTPYATITINSGSNTKQIHIDCTGGKEMDNCEKTEINAQSAESLYIESRGATFNGCVVNCPQNSEYNGIYPAPCYINALDNGKLSDLVINTLYGYPRDAYIDITRQSIDVDNVKLTCSALSIFEDVDNDIFNELRGNCYNTKVPTRSPTVQPTKHPTLSPITANPTTVNPTVIPTSNPTVNPIINPTKSPTKSPTNVPTQSTIAPSYDPTQDPTKYPTLISQAPIQSPTVFPSASPTDDMIVYTTNDQESKDKASVSPKGDHSQLNNALTAILATLVVLVICTVIAIVVFYIHYYRKKSISRAISISDRHSKVKVTTDANVNIVSHCNIKHYTAPVGSEMNQMDKKLDTGHTEEVVIRISRKENEIKRQTFQIQSGILNAGYDSDLSGDNDFVEMEDVKDRDDEKAAVVTDIMGHDMIAMNNVTLGNESVDVVDEVVESNSDDDVITAELHVTRGGD